VETEAVTMDRYYGMGVLIDRRGSGILTATAGDGRALSLVGLVFFFCSGI